MDEPREHGARWYDKPAVMLGDMVLDHDRRLDSIEIWRAEIRGAMQLVKFALGASIVSGVASAIALLRMLGL